MLAFAALLPFLFFGVSVAESGSTGLVPKVSLGVTADSGTSYAKLSPKLKWSASGKTIKDVTWTGGIDVDVPTTPDANEILSSVSFWGKAKRQFGNAFAASASVAVDTANVRQVDVDVEGSVSKTSSVIQITGSIGEDIKVNDIKLKQVVAGDRVRGKWTFTPKYSFKSGQADLKVEYGIKDTVLTIDTVGKKSQKLSLKQVIGEKNTIKPSITNDGQFELEYSRPLEDIGGVVSAKINPSSSLDLTWSDDVWQAKISAPLDGWYKVNQKGIKFNLKRSV